MLVWHSAVMGEQQKNDVPNIITIDGYLGSGRSTLADGICSATGFPQINVDAVLLRCALLASKYGIKEHQEDRLLRLADNMKLHQLLNAKISREMKEPHITERARVLFACPELAETLNGKFREVAALQKSGVVAVGTTMGYKVFPQAPVQFFLEARAKERFLRLCRKRKVDMDDEATRTFVEGWDNLAVLMRRRSAPWALHPNGDGFRAPVKKVEDYRPDHGHPQLYIHTDCIGAKRLKELALDEIGRKLPHLAMLRPAEPVI